MNLQSFAAHPSALAALVLALATAATGCGPDETTSACVTVDAACAPLYEPTFANVFERTLKPTCAQSGASCHALEGSQGGLAFDDEGATYDLLLGTGGAKARVLAGDAGCSLLVQRIEATDGTSMPPGKQLAAAERCSIEQWIANGANR